MIVLEEIPADSDKRKDAYELRCVCGTLLEFVPEDGKLDWEGDQDDKADWPYYRFVCRVCKHVHKFGRFWEHEPWWDRALTWARAWNGRPYLGITQQERWERGMR